MTHRLLPRRRIASADRRWPLRVLAALALALLVVSCADRATGSGELASVTSSPAPSSRPPASATMPGLIAPTSPLAPAEAAEPIAPTPTPLLIDESGVTGRGPLEVPIRVRIPRIGVDAEVEVVGLDPDGEMSAPRGYERVAWFGYGPTPGEPGASVIAGHVDSPRGPAVFWSLRDLQPGDRIEVELAGGETVRFVVEGSGWYVADEAPLDTIFAQDGPPRLHLVTCGGTFDHHRREYSHRLVVYARLVALDKTAGETSAHMSGAHTGNLPDAQS